MGYKCEHCGTEVETEIELEVEHRACRLKAAFPGAYTEQGDSLVTFDMEKVAESLGLFNDVVIGRDGQPLHPSEGDLHFRIRAGWGEPGRMALNHAYLLDFLSGKQGIVIVSQYDKMGPLVFQYQNSPRVLIMPMFVEWGDEKPTAAEKVEPEPETIEENPEVEPEEELESSLEEEATEAKEPEPVVVAPTETPAKRKRKR